MSTSLKLSILSPERRLIQGAEVSELTLTTSEGQIQVLPGHGAMVGTLSTGPFRYVDNAGTSEVGVISTGFFEVAEDNVTVLAETLELKGEIDVTRAQRAQKNAEEALKDAALDEHQFGKYQLKLQRALIRQQIAGKDHGDL